MATLRFGVPAPDDPEQVIMQARWGDRSTPRSGEYLRVIPYGAAISVAGEWATLRNTVTDQNEQVDVANAAGLTKAIYHPESGLLANNLDSVNLYNGGAHHDLVNGLQAVLAPTSLTMVAGLEADLDSEWFGLSDAAATQAALDAALDEAMTYYADKPNVIAYTLKDDLASVAAAVRANTAMTRIEQRDTVGRPASGTFQSDSARAAVNPDDWRYLMFYWYPCGHTMAITPTAEGDFSRPGGNNGVATDWAAGVRTIVMNIPAGTATWMFMQAHRTIDDPPSPSQLRYPTAREIRAMVWKTIGAGVKGFFWFLYQDQPPNWEGFAHPNSRVRYDAIAEMGARLSPGIRARIAETEPVAPLFTASGGGSTGWALNFANAYCETLADAAHGLTYCVVCNNSLSPASVTINSTTLTGSLRNLETGVETPIGGSVTLPALDGTIFQHIPGVDALTQTMLTASDNVVTGMRWMRTNGLARTGVVGNGSFEYNLDTGTTAIREPTCPVDDHDGNYGEAFKLHGLCLKYLRTHDATLIPDIEAQVQWHIDIERRLVAQRGEYWAGAAPYWIWPLATPSAPEFGGVGDPNINGGAGASITYNQGDVRVWTSIDQMHMVAHALYAYMYLLRDESAITANSTLRANCLALISRMATFEASNASFFVPAEQRVLGNLYQIAQGLTPTTNSGIVDADYSSTFKGYQFGNWQVSNVESNVDPSSNISIDVFMRAVMAPDSQPGGVLNFLRGMAMDMLSSDIGQHDVEWDPVYTGPVLPYPTGWVLRAAAGDRLSYENPRVLASNNGYSTDLHYVTISSGAARDQMSGRAPQRLIVLCLLALMDPTYNVPIELNPDTTVKRSVNIVTACNQWAETMAAHLPEPTTNCNRYMAQMHLGTTGSQPSNVIDSAFTGYWAMASELWHVVNAGANYADYYPIGLW